MYRSRMAGALPSGVPLEAAGAAKDHWAAPSRSPANFPISWGLVLIDVAREAFTQGLHLSAGISVVGSVGLAVLVGVVLRRVRGNSGSGIESEQESDGAVSVSGPPDGVIDRNMLDPVLVG